jgi:hypothetical protein
VSLISSIVGAVLIVFIVGIIGSIAGIVLGRMALNEMNRTGRQVKRGSATAGIWTGVGAIVLYAIVLIVAHLVG